MIIRSINLVSLVTAEIFIVLSAIHILPATERQLVWYAVIYFFTSVWYIFFQYILGGSAVHRYTRTRFQFFLVVGAASVMFVGMTYYIIGFFSTDSFSMPFAIALGVFVLSGMTSTVLDKYMLSRKDFIWKNKKEQRSIEVQIALFALIGLSLIGESPIALRISLVATFVCLILLEINWMFFRKGYSPHKNN